MLWRALLLNFLLASHVSAYTYDVVGRLDNLGDFGESISLSGNYLYMARNNVTRIIDVSNKAAPSLTGSYAHAGRASVDVETKGNVMYVVYTDSGVLDAVDITNKASPVKLTTIDLPSGSGGMEIVGNYGYVFFGVTVASNTMRVIDLNFSTAPRVIGGQELLLNVYPTSMVCNSTRCIVGHEANGTNSYEYLSIVAGSAPVNLSGTITSQIPSEPRGYSMCNGFGYAASYFEQTGIYSVDLANETEFRWVGNIPMPNPSWVTKTNATCTQVYTGMTDFYGTQDVFRAFQILGNGNLRQISNENIHLPTSIMGMAVDSSGYIYLGGRHTECSLRIIRINQRPRSSKRAKTKLK